MLYANDYDQVILEYKIKIEKPTLLYTLIILLNCFNVIYGLNNAQIFFYS
jgi:hypothetical protein